MRLSHLFLEDTIEFKENKINVLVIENKREYTELIQELIYQSETDDGGFVLSEDGEILSMNKIDVITDLFRLDINTRKNIGKLISEMSETAADEFNYEFTCRIKSSILNYVSSIAENIEFDIEVGDISVQDIFKMCGVRFSWSTKDICENIIDYIKITSSVSGKRLFVIINLHRFIDDENLKLLYDDILLNKYNILVIESICPEMPLNMEYIKIIDSDLCEIT